jgi:hypothetical protein
VIKLGGFLRPTDALARIKPPARSFADWERFLNECEAAGLCSTIANSYGESTGIFASPVAYALLRRWRWLRYCREKGISYEAGEALFDEGIEKADRERRNAERSNKGDSVADAVFSYARERGL